MKLKPKEVRSLVQRITGLQLDRDSLHRWTRDHLIKSEIHKSGDRQFFVYDELEIPRIARILELVNLGYSPQSAVLRIEEEKEGKGMPLFKKSKKTPIESKNDEPEIIFSKEPYSPPKGMTSFFNIRGYEQVAAALLNDELNLEMTSHAVYILLKEYKVPNIPTEKEIQQKLVDIIKKEVEPGMDIALRESSKIDD